MTLDAETPSFGERLEETLSRNGESAFWIVYVLVPMLTGFLAYSWLPHESFDPGADRAIASHEVTYEENEQDKTATVYDVWQDRKTGVIYTLKEFEEHRRGEAPRMAYRWFMYGLIGCCFFAFRQSMREKKFTIAFAQALAVDFALAAFTYFNERSVP